MQTTQISATAELSHELFEGSSRADLTSQMDDSLLKSGDKLISRSFYKDKKSAKKAQRKAKKMSRRKNRQSKK